MSDNQIVSTEITATNPISDNKDAIIADLLSCLEWYVKTDEVNMCDPENQYWIDGKNRAIEAIKKVTSA